MKKYYSIPRVVVVEVENEEILAGSELRVELWKGDITIDRVDASYDTKGYGNDAGSRQSDNYRSNLWGE